MKKENDVSELESTRNIFCFICFCNPQHWMYRYIILILVCYTQFTGFYCLDSPAGLKEIMIRVMDIDNTYYTLLFSVAEWSNIVVCVLSGVIIDKLIGVRLGSIIIAISALVGQIIFTIGTFINNYWILLIGRIIIGASDGVLIIASLTFQALWFEKDMSFAVAFTTAGSRFGGFVALAAPSFLYEYMGHYIHEPLYRLGAIHLIGVVLYVFALICFIITAALDWRGEQVLGKRQPKDRSISCHGLKNFSLMFWLYAVPFAVYSAVYMSFGIIGQSFYIYRYNLDIFQASVANALIFGIVIVWSPFFGFISDYTGHTGLWAIVGVLAFSFANTLLALCYQFAFVPYIGSLILSVSQTISNVALLSAIKMCTVEQNQLATAFGITFSLGAFMFSIISAVTGVLIDQAGYLILEVFYILLSYVVVLLLTTAAIIEYGGRE